MEYKYDEKSISSRDHTDGKLTLSLKTIEYGETDKPNKRKLNRARKG